MQEYDPGCIVYVDAARDDYVTGIGYAIEGNVNVTGRRYMHHNYTSMEAELQALLEGVRIASIESESRGRCVAYTDAKPLVTKMQYANPDDEQWSAYRESFLWLIQKFDNHSLHWCQRESNTDAHKLAQRALDEGRRQL